FVAEDKEIISILDRTLLIRVVTNLINNATQAVSGVADPQVLVSVFREVEEVCITVADNGIGIREEVRDRVFEPKFTTKTSGMGLGVGVVKNSVETYKGSIHLESQERSEETRV